MTTTFSIHFPKDKRDAVSCEKEEIAITVNQSDFLPKIGSDFMFCFLLSYRHYDDPHEVWTCPFDRQMALPDQNKGSHCTSYPNISHPANQTDELHKILLSAATRRPYVSVSQRFSSTLSSSSSSSLSLSSSSLSLSSSSFIGFRSSRTNQHFILCVA